MNDLNINYEQTLNLGKEVMNKGDELGEIIFKIQSIIAELQASWQGEDANKFLNNLEEETNEMKNLSLTVNEIGLLIQKIANTYQTIATNNMKL